MSIVKRVVMELCEEAARKFLSTGPFRFSPTVGGMNNDTMIVEDSVNNKYVLRIYNNGQDRVRVRFEHEILSRLQGRAFSFQIPTAIPSLESGSPSVVLSSGAEASLFQLIPGVLPKLTHAKEIGFAAGQLSAALGDIATETPSPNPPYYDLYRVHHAVTRDRFFEELRSTDFDAVRAIADEIAQEIVRMEELIVKLHELALPQQLIHGDLHYDNVLVCDGKVSGLLDFEFCAMDWRAMELAICLSKYTGESNPHEFFAPLLRGYKEHATLTDLETQVIPDLINLRILSNVVYFVGRAIAKEDSIATIIGKIETYMKRLRWIKSNRQSIIDLVQKPLRE